MTVVLNQVSVPYRFICMWASTAGVYNFVKISKNMKCTRKISMTHFFSETEGVA